jgi:hypothetical protein
MMHQVRDTNLRQTYEAPALKVVGKVGELTLTQDKKYGSSDGFTLMGIAITNASP